MLDERQIRLLELLEDKISQCDYCDFHTKKCLPYWTPLSKYLIIGKHPNDNEIDNEPLLDKNLWATMDKCGFRKEEFAIINNVQCQPPADPPWKNKVICEPWVRKFVKILEPQKILMLTEFRRDYIEMHTAFMREYHLTEKIIRKFKEL